MKKRKKERQGIKTKEVHKTQDDVKQEEDKHDTLMEKRRWNLNKDETVET